MVHARRSYVSDAIAAASALACLLLLSSSAILGQDQCFGTDQGPAPPDAGQDLYHLNVATGVISAPLPSGVPTATGFLTGYAYDGTQLFAANGGGGGGIVYTVNIVSGTHFDIGAVGGSLIPGTTAIADLAIQPGTLTLFGLYAVSGVGPPGAHAAASSIVGTISKTTGIVTALPASLGTPASSGGSLEFDATGTLFYADSLSLYTVSTATGVATAVGALSFAGAFPPPPGPGLRRTQGMGRRSDGTMFILVRDTGVIIHLATISLTGPTAGTCTFVATIATTAPTGGFFHGLGFVPPPAGSGPVSPFPTRRHKHGTHFSCFVDALPDTAHVAWLPLVALLTAIAAAAGPRRRCA